MKDLDLIKKLLALLNETNAGSIEVRKNLWSTTIRVSKDASIGNSGPVTYQVAASGNPAPAPSGTGPTSHTAPAQAEGETAHLTEVKSPMVGTFYAQPEPGAEPSSRR
jgi:acetyl-CoA carboxylase biotin carboxyl carrier protein